jgi:hypothetical protein
VTAEQERHEDGSNGKRQRSNRGGTWVQMDEFVTRWTTQVSDSQTFRGQGGAEVTSFAAAFKVFHFPETARW